MNRLKSPATKIVNEIVYVDLFSTIDVNNYTQRHALRMYIYVVVNFLSQVIILVFLLFLGMVMYANEVETKEK